MLIRIQEQAVEKGIGEARYGAVAQHGAAVFACDEQACRYGPREPRVTKLAPHHAFLLVRIEAARPRDRVAVEWVSLKQRMANEDASPVGFLERLLNVEVADREERES